MFVSVDPPGDYSVQYDGKSMTKTGDEYYILTKKLDGGNYASHVTVSKN